MTIPQLRKALGLSKIQSKSRANKGTNKEYFSKGELVKKYKANLKSKKRSSVELKKLAKVDDRNNGRGNGSGARRGPLVDVSVPREYVEQGPERIIKKSYYNTYKQLEGVYVGEMEGDQRHGYGTYNFASGAKYVGSWKNGKKHGQGTYTRADGTIYHSGEWVNNESSEKLRVSSVEYFFFSV